MRINSKKKKISKDDILLIVENSEVLFFRQYFNQYIQQKYGIRVKCESSGAGDKCEITNFNKMSKRVERAIQKEGFKVVFLMIDLKTKCFQSEQTHDCLVKLKREYQPKYKILKELKDKFYLFVVCNEIESWFLTIDRDTNNLKNHKKELMKLLNVNSEPQMVQKMIQELKNGKFELDFTKNISLQHFIKKLQQFNAS